MMLFMRRYVIEYYQPPVTNYQSPVLSYQYQVSSIKYQVSSIKFQVSSFSTYAKASVDEKVSSWDSVKPIL